MMRTNKFSIFAFMLSLLFAGACQFAPSEKDIFMKNISAFGDGIEIGCGSYSSAEVEARDTEYLRIISDYATVYEELSSAEIKKVKEVRASYLICRSTSKVKNWFSETWDSLTEGP
ncbi:hypothetical protein [Lewinella cohaerens]|uniref:hypothetical protein n=1 Tax=Lewinella cohaerens TaxID=70995 RepID=UPI0003657F3B|nr:hypothetical protein [Lewinella cohaerens]